jgi:nicotinamide-nucleotide amidase
MVMKGVTVLCTGNELLYGSTQNTNSGFISERLFPLELRVRMHLVVGDDIDELERALRYALNSSDIIIVTGGLGPTDDDNTIAALKRICGFTVTVDERSKDKMAKYFMNMGMSISGADLKMVEVPSGARILSNTYGIAPGFIIQKEENIIIALPGVPGEMAEMMDASVIPFIKKEYNIRQRKNVSIRVIGMKESEINEIVKSMDIELTRLEWAITAKQGITTVTFAQKPPVSFDADGIVSEAERLFGDRLLDPSFECPEEEVIQLLREQGMTVAAAESCTGGLVSKRLTDIPGSSDVFTGSVIAYSNRVKVEELGVPEEKLARYGAVSEEVAAEMAYGVRTILGTDIGVSITGIAGPGGGTDLKPVGTVCFGLADANGAKSYTRTVSGNRERVRVFASLIAIENLRKYLKGL